MNRLLVLAITGALAQTAFALDSQAPVNAGAERASSSYYYWLHPKLGHVKVDRATNAIITGRKVAPATQEGSAKPDGSKP